MLQTPGSAICTCCDVSHGRNQPSSRLACNVQSGRDPGGAAHFRKYWSPDFLLSRNGGRNLDITLFGGRGGTAASKLGNVCTSLRRKSSNSEYRFRMLMAPPYTRVPQVSGCSWLARTWRAGVRREPSPTFIVSTRTLNTTKAPILVVLPLTTT